VWLESRYRKLVRGLPQTILYCPTCKGSRRRRVGCVPCGGRGKLTEDSVQELIGRVLLPRFRARTGKFHGAGREDVDVRMLGDGRPFVYEVVGAARTDVDLEQARAAIHELAAGRIELDPLQPCSRDRVAYWKAVQLDKTYRAEATLAAPPPRPLAELAGRRVAIAQRTPQRVAHRRADAVRDRWVEVLSVTPTGERTVDVVVRCAHGTYVKEWISGDDGRTTPSFADLAGVPAQCTALDVLAVECPASAPAGRSSTD